MEIVNEFLEAYKEMGCRMSLKVHFLHSHLDAFPENLGQFSDEQVERFHQGMLLLENRFQGKCHISLMAKYCCSIRCDTADEDYNRQRTSMHFSVNKKKHPS